MGGSVDGKRLYPILEGAFTDDTDQPAPLRMYEFDTGTGHYTGKRWAYQTTRPPTSSATRSP